MNSLSLDEISDYLQGVHKYDGYLMALCEFHEDHNPSMRVTTKYYKCMSCGEGGRIETLIEKVSGRVIEKKKIAYNAGFVWNKWLDRFGSVQSISKIAHEYLYYNLHNAEYLFSRKFTQEDIRQGKIGLLDSYFTFPIKDEYGVVQGIVVRASPTIQTKTNRYSVSPDCSQKLYIPDWRSVNKATAIYLCYGTLDAWSLKMCGYAGVTGISGQELNPKNLESFRKPIYIIPDRHEERNAIELSAGLGWRGKVLLLNYPEDCKDINDVHRIHGANMVQQLIEEKKEHYNYG
jgi:DNA primase